MNDEEMQRAAMAGHNALDQFAPFLEMLEGLVATARRNGFTDDQARAIVAFTFGWRPTDGSTPDGAP